MPPWGPPGPEGPPQEPYGGADPTRPLYPPPPYDPPPGAGYGPPPGQLPPSGYGPPPPGGGRGGSKLPLVVALVVIGVVVVGALTAGGIAYVNANDKPSPTPRPTPTQSTSIWSATPEPSPTLTSAPPTKDPSKLDKRSTDSKPLSVSEMFPRTFRGTSGYTYKRYRTFSTTHCTSSRYIHGPRLISALSSGKCSQLLVASYVDRRHNVQTNAGIANLVDSTHAKHASGVASAKGPFFRTLPGPAAWHTAYAFDESHGHYVPYQIVAAAQGTTDPKKFGAKAFLGFADMQALLERPLDKR